MQTSQAGGNITQQQQQQPAQLQTSVGQQQSKVQNMAQQQVKVQGIGQQQGQVQPMGQQTTTGVTQVPAGANMVQTSGVTLHTPSGQVIRHQLVPGQQFQVPGQQVTQQQLVRQPNGQIVRQQLVTSVGGQQ